MNDFLTENVRMVTDKRPGSVDGCVSPEVFEPIRGGFASLSLSTDNNADC